MPYRHYCSGKCSSDFEYWFARHFYWGFVTEVVRKRDNHTCQICGYRESPRSWYDTTTLEVDHIRPMYYMGYYWYLWEGRHCPDIPDEFLPNMVYIHNYKNLRSLCHDCHRKVTNEFLKRRSMVYEGFRMMFGDEKYKKYIRKYKLDKSERNRDYNQTTLHSFIYNICVCF